MGGWKAGIRSPGTCSRGGVSTSDSNNRAIIRQTSNESGMPFPWPEQKETKRIGKQERDYNREAVCYLHFDLPSVCV